MRHHLLLSVKNSAEWRREHLGRLPSWSHREPSRRDRGIAKQGERANHDDNDNDVDFLGQNHCSRYRIRRPFAARGSGKIRRSKFFLSFLSWLADGG